MRTSTFWTVLGLLFTIELIAARTLEHHQVITSPNGGKVTRSWTTHESDETTSDDGNPFDEIKKITDSLQRENMHKVDNTAKTNAATIQTGSITLGDLMKQGGQVPGIGPIPIQELMNTQGPLSRTYVDKDGQLVRATYGMPGGNTPAQFVDIFGKGGLETDQAKPAEPTAWEWATPTGAKPITNIHNEPNHVRVTQHWQTIPQPYFTRTTSYSSTPTWTSWSSSLPSAPAAKEDNAKEQDQTIQPTIKLPVSWQWNSTWRQPTESFNWNEDYINKSSFDATDTQPIDISTKWTSKPGRYPNLYDLYPNLSTDVGKTTTTTLKPKSSFEEFPEIISSTTTKTPIKKINIEDLPVTAILQNGKPADEEFLKTLPAYLRPVQGAEQPKTIRTEYIPMSTTFDQPRPVFLTPETEEILRTSGITEDDIKASNGEPITRTRLDPDGKIVRTTYRVSNTPTVSLGPMPAKSPSSYDSPMTSNGNLTPETEEILRKSGITEDDIKASNGEPITRTRIDPDGKIVKTTYRISNTPTVLHAPISAKSPSIYDNPIISNGNLTPETEEILRKSGITEDDIKASNGEPITRIRLDPDGKIIRTTYRVSNTPTVSLEPAKIPATYNSPVTANGNIANFLAKLGLNVNDIRSRPGQKMTKSIIDEDGNILTATFLYSSVKNGFDSGLSNIGHGGAEQSQLKPIK